MGILNQEEIIFDKPPTSGKIILEDEIIMPSSAPPVIAQLAPLTGKTPPGFRYNEMGQLEPVGKGIIQPGLEKPIEPAKGVLDFATRVVPQSAYRTAVGITTFPYQAIKSVTDPIIEGIAESAKTGEGSESAGKALGGVGKSAVQTVEGLARFTGEPLGLYGWETFKNKWLADPVGSIVGLVPLVKGIATYAKNNKISNQQAAARIASDNKIGEELIKNVKENIPKPSGRILKPEEVILEKPKVESVKPIVKEAVEQSITPVSEMESSVTTELGGLQTVYETLLGKKKAVEELPKYARSVNLERQKIPEEYKQFETKVAEELGPKKVQTWDQTGKLSEEILSDPKRAAKVLEKAKKGEGLNTAEMLAARQINVNAIDTLKKIGEESPTLEQFNKSYIQFRDDVFSAMSDASSEMGRGLNIHKKEISVNRMATAFSKLKRGLNEREFNEFKQLNTDNPIEVKRFMDRLGDPKFKDYFYEFWYNSILSGIPTHVVNVAGNTLWSAFQVPHRALMAGIDTMISPLRGGKREYFFREIVPMLAGYKSGFRKGASGALEAVKTGRTTQFETKWSRDIGESTIGAFERSPYPILRNVAPVISAPTRALRAMDVWANSMAFDAQIGALAKRSVLQKKGLSKEAGQKLYGELEKNPTEAMMKDAGGFAEYSTFTDAPGKFTQWISQGRDVIPGGRLIVPFVNTIANLFKRGIEMTPVLGAVKAKGTMSVDIIAKQIEGTIISLYVMHKIKDGLITGPAPKNETERDAFFRQGKLPWAIKLGDKWYQYRRVEPFNTVIASVATAYENIKRSINKEQTATELFGNVADGIVSNLLDSSYLQGITNLLDKYGKRKGMIQRTFASFVPFSGFWRSVNRAYEAATKGEPKVRDTSSWLGAFSQVIPGLSENLPPRMNVWGKEISIPGGILRQWLPFKYSDEINDPTEKELERLGIYPGFPKQNLTIASEKIKLSDEEYRDYCLYYGSIAKDIIDFAIQTEKYQGLDDDAKAKELDHILTKVRSDVLKEVKEQHMKKFIEEVRNGQRR